MGDLRENNAAKQRLYRTYKKQFQRAFRAECYLECIFISYAMIEDRLLSILFHLGIADRANDKKPKWAQKPRVRRNGYIDGFVSTTAL